MDRFESMHCIIRVVEAGSIRGAANRFNVAKSPFERIGRTLKCYGLINLERIIAYNTQNLG